MSDSNSIDKPKRTLYNRDLLDEILLRDGATLIGEYEKLNRETVIQFKCKCGVECSKTFRRSYENMGCYCKKCGIEFTLDKMKKTMQEKHGVDYPSQSKDIREKVKATCIEHYGVEYSLQSPTIRQQIKDTNLEKYGVTCTVHAPEIREKVEATNLEKYGVKHSLQSTEIREKGKKTMIERLGVEHPSQSDKIKKQKIIKSKTRYGTDYVLQSKEIREQGKITIMQKYGVEYISQSPEIQNKIKNTCLEKYGVEYPSQHPEIKDKVKNTIIEKYGTDNIMQLDYIKDKIKQTCLVKYGVEYAMQNQEVFAKSQANAYRAKDFTMPSGISRKVQGYEPFALRDLLAAGVTEDQIKTERKDVPRIKYSTGEKDRYYFPDIFIPHQNRLVEVKSTWTYKCKTDFVVQKGDAAKAAGYNYELWIYDAKGNSVNCEEPKNDIIPPPNI
jgi:glutathione peroxidase-family protein